MTAKRALTRDEGTALALHQLLRNQLTAFQNCFDVGGVPDEKSAEMRKRMRETETLIKNLEGKA